MIVNQDRPVRVDVTVRFFNDPVYTLGDMIYQLDDTGSLLTLLVLGDPDYEYEAAQGAALNAAVIRVSKQSPVELVIGLVVVGGPALANRVMRLMERWQDYRVKKAEASLRVTAAEVLERYIRETHAEAKDEVKRSAARALAAIDTIDAEVPEPEAS